MFREISKLCVKSRVLEALDELLIGIFGVGFGRLLAEELITWILLLLLGLLLLGHRWNFGGIPFCGILLSLGLTLL